MREYEIWMDKAICQEGVYPARELGRYEAKSFQEACKLMLADHPEFNGYYSVEYNSVWGCKLFYMNKKYS
jgi:hypothetical protein